MKRPKTELKRLLARDEFPRASSYDPDWLVENQMGPNVLWISEYLASGLDLRPGMKVLDLGCGKAVSSIFFAKEFDVEVWATDLWISADDNASRILEAGLDSQVHAVHAEAHSLPFENESFDAIVSLDSYHYYGTDDLYIGYITRFLKRGGQIGFVSPGLTSVINSDPPKHLQPFWYWDFCSFHTAKWWKRHWDKTGKVAVETADAMPDGWKYWRDWNQICAKQARTDDREGQMLDADGGRYLGFVRVIGRRPDSPELERWAS